MLWAQDQFLKAKPAKPAGPSARPEAGLRASQALLLAARYHSNPYRS